VASPRDTEGPEESAKIPASFEPSRAHETAYNHAITLAIEVVSFDPRIPSLDEAMAALRVRVAQLEGDLDEAFEALLGELPFDTFETISPRSAAQCEREMVAMGTHCANPSEHPEP
jgi:hypothetical protein